ncbi:MAG: sodium:alanine symporter family protein [Ruminiclostridium sp.]|nr:sodium:alanine symporter family protein [Ruminiclostridium sp.]
MEIIKWLNENIIWGVPMLLLFTFTGVIFAIRLKGFRIFSGIGTLFRKSKADEKGISPFAALTATLGTTLGTGNIIAIGTAITFGGAGAVFWMWIAALLGMMTCYAENYLGHRYRIKTEVGYKDVPFRYIRKAFGNKKRGCVISGIFAALCVGASFGMGNMAQINSAGAVLKRSIGVPLWVTGIVCATLVIYFAGRGVKHLSELTVWLIPMISVLYIAGCLWVIITGGNRMGEVLSRIIKEAFSVEAVSGGAAGSIMLNAMMWGVKRGVFSNEAGLGTSVMINADSDCDTPHKQGLWAVLQVFIDTIIMCSLTAFAILISGADKISADGIDIAGIAFGSVMGDAGNIFLSVLVLIFAVATVSGWCIYGKKCVEYLMGSKWTKGYFYIFILLCFVGAIARTDLVWELSDLLNGLMAIPNLTALLILRKEIK